MLQPHAEEVEVSTETRTRGTQEWKELSREPEFPLRFVKSYDFLSGSVIGGILKARLDKGHELTFINDETSPLFRWQFIRANIVAPEEMGVVTLGQHKEPRPHPDNTKMNIEVEIRQHDERESVWGIL